MDAKNGLFTITGGDLDKPISGRNLGKLLAHNPALRGVELAALHVANEKLLETYFDKLGRRRNRRDNNFGVLDELNNRVYIYNKNGDLGYYESDDQGFVSNRWNR